jgi:hypothetical protein
MRKPKIPGLFIRIQKMVASSIRYYGGDSSAALTLVVVRVPSCTRALGS